MWKVGLLLFCTALLAPINVIAESFEASARFTWDDGTPIRGNVEIKKADGTSIGTWAIKRNGRVRTTIELEKDVLHLIEVRGQDGEVILMAPLMYPPGLQWTDLRVVLRRTDHKLIEWQRESKFIFE